MRFVFGLGPSRESKSQSKGSVKRLTEQVKGLLGVMFHARETNSKLKMNAAEMHAELLRHAHQGEIQQHNIPKVSTIANWITRTSRAIKHNMALEFLEKHDAQDRKSVV